MYIKTKIFLLCSTICILLFSCPAHADYSNTQYHMKLQNGGELRYVKYAITLTKQDISPELYNRIYNHIKDADKQLKNDLLEKCPDQDPLTVYIDQDLNVILQNCDIEDTFTYPYPFEPNDNSINLNNLATIEDEPVGTELIQNASNLVFENGKLYVLSCKPGYYLCNSQGYSNIYGDLYSLCMPNNTPNDNTDNSTKPEPQISSPNKTQVFAQMNTVLQNDIFRKSDVWTDKDGDFNTARLISDSVAGVVLGTVGGVITSKIITKNQVKDGFETLKCTISGQDIANYGDEFTIDIK